MNYNALDGLTIGKNLTFSEYGIGCSGSTRNYAVSSSKNSDDGQHPVVFSNIYFNNVNNESKLWIHRPNLDKINPSDCVDMDCDGLKKQLLTDKDGSFLGGSPGTVIAQSDFGWCPGPSCDLARGLGDFRIPKEALADSQGHLRNISDVYKYRGLVRDESLCTYKDSWQAYECHGLDHRMMMIESMDSDTEMRRLSPVAVFGDDNKYIDLINGPQGN